MSRDQRGSGEPRRRFEFGCGHIFLAVFALAAVLVFRIGKVAREEAAAESVRQLGGMVLYGKETVPVDWFYGPAHALDDIVKEHPREANRVLPIALKALNDPESDVGYVAPFVPLETIAKACPGQAKAIVQQLLDMLQSNPGEARWRILEALRGVAPQSAEAAEMALPALLGLLRDKAVVARIGEPLAPGEESRQSPERTAVPRALGRIAEKHPKHIPEIVRATLPFVEGKDPAVKLTASLTLSSVAEGMCAGNAQ